MLSKGGMRGGAELGARLTGTEPWAHPHGVATWSLRAVRWLPEDKFWVFSVAC